ncbi:MAG: hypothetical protein K5685_06865 [Bacteroidales bacterium]|nr:hypothetical protein [Bacteroidales bacterium]
MALKKEIWVGLLQPGESISIELWYNRSKELKVFDGYIKEFSDNGGKYTLYLENEVYRLRTVVMENGVLHMHAPYTKTFWTVIYDTSVNIDKDGFDIKFLTKDQRKLRVVYKGKNKDGKPIESDVKGDPDGNIVTVEFKGVTTKDSLNRMANDYAAMKMFEGVDGDFIGWLYPICRGGYRAEMRFRGQIERNGIYYVQSVEIRFDSSGAQRRVTLSKKLS